MYHYPKHVITRILSIIEEIVVGICEIFIKKVKPQRAWFKNNTRTHKEEMPIKKKKVEKNLQLVTSVAPVKL